MRLNEFIEDYPNLREAAGAFGEALQRAAENGALEARIDQAVLRMMNSILDRYRTSAGVAAGCGRMRPARFPCEILLGDAGGRLEVIPIEGGHLIVVDRNLFLGLVLFSYFTGLSGTSDGHKVMAAWMLVALVFATNAKLGYLDEIFCLALNESRWLMSDLLRGCAEFIVGHEVGHLYHEAHGTHLASRLAYESEGFAGVDMSKAGHLRLHPDGNHWTAAPGPSGHSLLIPRAFEHWRVEHASDLFACYLKVVLEGEGVPAAAELESLTHHLSLWQLCLYPLTFRQLLRQRGERTHPPPSARIEVIIWHLDQLADDFAPEWRSYGMTLLKRHYERLWAQSTWTLFDDLRLYVQYTVDAHGQGAIGRKWRSFAIGGEIPRDDGLFETLRKHTLADLFQDSAGKKLSDLSSRWEGQLVQNARAHRLNDVPIIIKLGDHLSSIGMAWDEEASRERKGHS